MRWLQAPVAMTRLTLFAITGLIGLLGGGGIVAGTMALRHAAAERDRAIAQDRVTVADVKRIAKQVVEIQTPSRKELLRRVELALEACARDPQCATALSRAARTATAGDRAATGLDRGATRRLEPGTTPSRSRAPVPGDTSPRRRATRRRDPGDPSPPTSPQPSPPPEQPTPRPGITTPPLPGIGQPHLCTPLVDVNC